tara:strand:- start:42 stop:551 length:510 start_codon:yes stop_codon:yes gene_type:complete
MINLKNLLNESFGFGELPSSKLIKMKKTLAEVMADDIAEPSDEESVSEGTDDMDRMQEINVDFSQFIKKNLKKIKMLPTDKQKQFGKLLAAFKDGLDDLSDDTNESVVNEAKIAFVNDKLVGDRIQKSGLLPLLGDNNASLNSNKMKFTKELSATLKKLYKKYSSLPIK